MTPMPATPMPAPYTAVLSVIARSTYRQLARQASYLKSENQIVRSRLPDRLILTQREKNSLVRFAKNLDRLHSMNWRPSFIQEPSV